jgi:hypothetical protein
MLSVNETAIVLERAGIEKAESFNEFLSRMAEKSAKAVKDLEPLDEIKGRADYTYAKRALSSLRAVKKETEDGRKRITKQLDEAKKAAISFAADATEPVDEAIARLDLVKGEAEERWRAEKKQRLERHWEETYPALALCIGDADPLVPFEHVFDPGWVKRISEVNNDKPAIESMQGIADRLAAGETAIDTANNPDSWKRAAREELYRTFDLASAYRAAEQSEAKARAVEARKAAQVAPEPQKPAKAAPAGSTWLVTIHAQTIECSTREEVQRIRDALRLAGVRGNIEKIS